MTKAQDQERLAHAIKDAEARLKVFKTNLDTVEKEIGQLATLETTLEENIKFLRKKSIIALAVEYRKAKDDLNKTKNRLAFIRVDRENINRAVVEIDQFLVITKTAIAKLLKSGDNVIKGNFGRKDGQD